MSRVPIMSDWRMKCNGCSTSEAELRRCTRCLSVYYCSKNCQRIDWASHKKLCVKKLDTKSAGDGIYRKATKELSENKQEAERFFFKETDVERICSIPPSKKETDIAGAENAGRKTNVDMKRSTAKSHDAERNKQSLNAYVEFTSTDRTTGSSMTKTQFPFRNEKGTCKGCLKPFCAMKCANCKAIFYCSKKCQRSDWPVHKKHCKKVSDEVVPKKKAPLTDDEAYIVDNMKRRQQRFNEGMFKGTFDIDSPFVIKTNYSGPFERLLASATPDMLKIHERPSGSLSKALQHARAYFPGWTVIDDFQDIPHEVSRMMVLLQEMQKESMRNVLVAFMFMYHDHVMRHGVFLKDASDKITHVEFYFDHINDDPSPYFSFADVTPGNYILLQNPLIHQFQDGQVGIRIDNPAEVKVYKTEE